MHATVAITSLLASSTVAQTDKCRANGDCGSCLADKADNCGWCIPPADKGGAVCLSDSSRCSGVWEKTSCPDCNKPWIRFAHASPTTHKLSCTITQQGANGTLTYTWSNYKFGEFSEWVQKFEVGSGLVVIKDENDKIVVQASRPLTPGPLIVVVKGSWPLMPEAAVETIAASYLPIPKGMAGVRLFNLSPDPPGGKQTLASMQVDGTDVATDIKFTLGSEWAHMDLTEHNFSVYDDSSGANKKVLATLDLTPPFGASTVFLLGAPGNTTAVNKIDAPLECGGAPPIVPKTPAPTTTPAPTPAPTPKPTPAPTPAPPAHPNCSVDMDFMFVLDGSGSITSESWEIDLKSVSFIANNFTFGCKASGNAQEARMGIVQFGSAAKMYSHLTCDKSAFLDALNSMPKDDGTTMTGDAMQLTELEMNYHARPNSYKAALVITDGSPTGDAQSMAAAKAAAELRSNNTDIFGIAVGDEAKIQELQQLASQPYSKFLYKVDDWHMLPPILHTIIDAICNHKTPPPPPFPDVDY